MSRWLLHYSPFAVILRLCSMSVLLSYACMQLFFLTGATHTTGVELGRALPVWVAISIAILTLYFCTQQDISVEEDEDDQGRRQVLRTKCLIAIAATSLLSLLAFLFAFHFDEISTVLGISQS